MKEKHALNSLPVKLANGLSYRFRVIRISAQISFIIADVFWAVGIKGLRKMIPLQDPSE